MLGPKILKFDPQKKAVLRRALQCKYGEDGTPALSPQEMKQLQIDLLQQLKVRPPAEAVKIVPQPEVQQKLKEIAEKRDGAQTAGGLLGGLGGAAVGGGVGALTTGLAKGLEKAPTGLMMAIPGAFKGYRLGKTLVKNKEIKGLLAGEYQAPKTEVPKTEVPPKVAASLDDLLNHLFPQKAQQKPPILSTVPERLKQYHPSFRERQGKQTIRGRLRRTEQDFPAHSQRDVLKRVFRMADKVPTSSPGEETKGLLSEGDSRTKDKGFRPKGKRTLSPPKDLKGLWKQNPKTFAIMGGLAALSALGLTAAQIQKYRKKQKNQFTSSD